MHSICKKIIKNLTDDLRSPKYQGDPNPVTGHCYVASEVLYHLWGKENGYKPHILKINGDTHWFLKKNNNIADITKDQFDFPLNYEESRGNGFLTREPSKRAKILIERINETDN